jgi:hypothetical protein
VRRNSTNDFETVAPLLKGPDSIALTGLSSSRLEILADRRISSSPML